MALPHLIKFVYNNGTDEVIRRGKKIHSIGYVELVEHDDLLGSVTFRVKDDSYATFYKVYIQKYKDPKGLSVRCTCPYNLGDICRHETAALLQLQELLDKNILGEKDILYHQRHTVIKMKDIDLKTIKLLSSPESYTEAETIMRSQKANLLSAANERVEASLVVGGDTYIVVLQKNEERNFDTSCKCEEQGHPLCVHKVAVFLQMLTGLIILIRYATGINKRINCSRRMVIRWKMILQANLNLHTKKVSRFSACWIRLSSGWIQWRRLQNPGRKQRRKQKRRSLRWQ